MNRVTKACSFVDLVYGGFAGDKLKTCQKPIIHWCISCNDGWCEEHKGEQSYSCSPRMQHSKMCPHTQHFHRKVDRCGIIQDIESTVHYYFPRETSVWVKSPASELMISNIIVWMCSRLEKKGELTIDVYNIVLSLLSTMFAQNYLGTVVTNDDDRTNCKVKFISGKLAWLESKYLKKVNIF